MFVRLSKPIMWFFSEIGNFFVFFSNITLKSYSKFVSGEMTSKGVEMTSEILLALFGSTITLLESLFRWLFLWLFLFLLLLSSLSRSVFDFSGFFNWSILVYDDDFCSHYIHYFQRDVVVAYFSSVLSTPLNALKSGTQNVTEWPVAASFPFQI